MTQSYDSPAVEGFEEFDCDLTFCDSLRQKKGLIAPQLPTKWYICPFQGTLVNCADVDSACSSQNRSFGCSFELAGGFDMRFIDCEATNPPTPLIKGGSGSLRSPLAALAAYSSDVYVSNLSWMFVGGCVAFQKFLSEFVGFGLSGACMGDILA